VVMFGIIAAVCAVARLTAAVELQRYCLTADMLGPLVESTMSTWAFELLDEDGEVT